MNIFYFTQQLEKSSLKNQLDVLYVPDSTSTMSDAKNYATPLKKPLLFIAEDQKKARGRFGRPFYTEKKNGIYFGLKLPITQENLSPSQLILCASIALCETILLYDATLNPQIKWVNDVYIDKKKVAGILAEGVLGEDGHLDAITIGSGINLSIPQDHFPIELQQKVRSIFTSKAPLPEDFLLTFIIYFFQWKKKDISFIQAKYKSYLFVLNQVVTFNYQGEVLSGIPIDINEEGNLIVQLRNNKQITLSSGEISLLSF